jgi:hypothetical protein
MKGAGREEGGRASVRGRDRMKGVGQDEGGGAGGRGGPR